MSAYSVNTNLEITESAVEEQSEDESKNLLQTAKAILEQRKQYYRISTGSTDLDDLLGGGIEQGAITEFYGEYRTGKTQICLQVILHTVMPESFGGLNSKAVYIDTEGSFRPERIIQMAEKYNLNSMDILDRILVGKANTTVKQIEYVKEIEQLIQNEDVKLVVIDSLTANFRAEFIGENSIVERQQLLNKHLHQLAQLANLADGKQTPPLAIIVTNQVVSNMKMFAEESIDAAGGHIVSHATTHRICLGRDNSYMEEDSLLKATLIDSPYLPEKTAYYKIATTGIEDTERKVSQNFHKIINTLKQKQFVKNQEIEVLEHG
jgi:DNA repair protein RadA